VAKKTFKEDLKMETQQEPVVSKEHGLQPQSKHKEGHPPLTAKVFGETFERVKDRANKGDERAREVLKKYLDGHPELVSYIGNMARYAEAELIKTAAGSEWVTGEAIRREAARMRRELTGLTPTPLESMAVERIVATWLQLQHTEMQFVQSQKDLSSAKYWLRRLEVVDRLYRAAIGSLVTLRELLPATAPASMPAIVDASAQAAKPEAGGMIEPPYVPVEIPIGNGHGTNRIADVLARRGASRCLVADDQVDEPPKLNGHHHRLEELLANGSNGHAKQGGFP
jgi:hypothetical protein